MAEPIGPKFFVGPRLTPGKDGRIFKNLLLTVYKITDSRHEHLRFTDFFGHN